MSSEFERIDNITGRLVQGRWVMVGPGDDAAQLECPHGSVLASTDILVEGVHFRQDWTSPFDLGRRAAAQNFADIAAMGCNPTALLVAVAAPKEVPDVWYTDLARGLQAECELVAASVIGGDLSLGAQIVVSVTALGDPSGGEPVLRSGAHVGDVVAIAGRLGWSATGLLALQRGIDVDARLFDAYRHPSPDYAAGPAGRAAGATAMIDVSDGLLADAAHIADASGVSIALESALLMPDDVVVEAAGRLGIDPMQAVLTGGEDHAILATFPAEEHRAHQHVPNPMFRIVGRVIERGTHAVLVDGQPHPGLQGHDHFA